MQLKKAHGAKEVVFSYMLQKFHPNKQLKV